MDNNELLQRQVPYSLDAERSVIGSVLVDPAKISTIGVYFTRMIFIQINTAACIPH